MMEGLYDKYEVRKRDGTPTDPNAVYFVLRLDTDIVARHAMWTYAKDTRTDTKLGEDLVKLLTSSWPKQTGG